MVHTIKPGCECGDFGGGYTIGSKIVREDGGGNETTDPEGEEENWSLFYQFLWKHEYTFIT